MRIRTMVAALALALALVSGIAAPVLDRAADMAPSTAIEDVVSQAADGVGADLAAAHNYTYANWYTCRYEVYEEVPRSSGTHGHRFAYSYPMPPNYCTS